MFAQKQLPSVRPYKLCEVFVLGAAVVLLGEIKFCGSRPVGLFSPGQFLFLLYVFTAFITIFAAVVVKLFSFTKFARNAFAHSTYNIADNFVERICSILLVVPTCCQNSDS